MSKTDPAASLKLSLSSIPIVHGEATIRCIAGEWIASTAQGTHSFTEPDGSESEVAVKMIQSVDGKRSIADIAELVTNYFEVSLDVAQTDALRFMGILIQKNILVCR
jgi:hypothetical protein